MTPASPFPVRIEVPAAPIALVARYTVMAGYATQGSEVSLGVETYDAGGGIYSKEISAGDIPILQTVRLRVVVEFVAASSLPPWTVDRSYSKDDIQQTLPLGINYSLDLPNRNPQTFEIAMICDVPFEDADYLTVQWAYRNGSDTYAGQTRVVPGMDLPHADQLSRPISVYDAQFFRTPNSSTAEKLALQISGTYRGVSLVPFVQEVDLQALYAFKVVKLYPAPSRLDLVPFP